MSNELKARLRQAKPEVSQKKSDLTLKAVVYGHGLPSRSLELETKDFQKLYKQVKHSSLFDLQVDGETPVKALIGEVQVNPVNMQPIHVDFRQIRMDEKVTVPVPLVFIGESPAIKALGGTLVKSLDELEVECLPADLPKEIAVDLSRLVTFEDMITVGSLALPQGVEATNDAEEAVATVEAPLSEEEQKKLEQGEVGDVTAVKTEAEEKKEKEAAEEASEASKEE